MSTSGRAAAGNWPVVSGSWYYTSSPGATSAQTRPNATMICKPFYVPNAITIAQLAAEVTVVGDAGAQVRLGIYRDGGGGPTGACMEAGTVPGDAVAVAPVAYGTPLALGPGWYWEACAVQLSPGGLLQLRVVAASNQLNGYQLPLGAALPGANGTAIGLSFAGVAGALPANPAGGVLTGAAARLMAKLA